MEAQRGISKELPQHMFIIETFRESYFNHHLCLQEHLNKANTPDPICLKPPIDSSFKSREYTPPTPNLSNSVFSKRIKSPRRALLAKRALLIQKQEERYSQKKGSSLLVQPSPAACQCYEKPQICSLCSSRYEMKYTLTSLLRHL